MPKFKENSRKEKDQIRACFANYLKIPNIKKKLFKHIVLGKPFYLSKIDKLS